MKPGWICLSLLTLLIICTAAPSAAGSPTTDSAVASSTMATPSSNSGSCSGAAVDPVAVSTDGVTAQAYCQSDCDGLLISCWGGTCSAADRNCSTGQQGYIQCDGVYNFCHQGPCSTSCPCGTCGSTRWVNAYVCFGYCQQWKEQECTASGWADTGATDCVAGPCYDPP
jgi:hypothetical protein